MNGTSPTQRPLEFTPAMSLVMVVVLLVGWLGWIGQQDNEPPALQPRPIIRRVSDQAVHIPQCSLSVTPTAGWFHLLIENRINREPTFINKKTQTIATFDLSTQSNESPGREVQYDHVTIVWRLEDRELGGTNLLEGWIKDHSVPARLRILSRGKSTDDDPSIATLCNAIHVDD